MQRQAILLSALLAASLLGAAAAPAASQQASGEAYSGTHVEFASEGNAVTEYSVDGDVVVENVTMRAESAAREESGSGLALGVAADLPAAAIESRSAVAAGVSVQFASGGELEANDNRHGIAQFRATEESQVVSADLASSAEVEQESDERVVVRKDDGTTATFLVVGDGNVTAENGSVNAMIEQDSQLVYRQYDDERSESEKKQERLIQNGTATAEVFVRSTVEAGAKASEDAEATATDTAVENATATGTATATDTATATATQTDSPTATSEAAAEANATSVVTYDQDTEIDVTSRTDSEVNATVKRTESDGKVVIMTVADDSYESAEDLEVYVDGEAAAQADSYSEVRSAAEDGDESKYLVQQSSSAEAATDVVIGINHFSERQVSVRNAESGDASGDDDGGLGGGSDADGAGFGALAALAALAAALVAARTR